MEKDVLKKLLEVRNNRDGTSIIDLYGYFKDSESTSHFARQLVKQGYIKRNYQVFGHSHLRCELTQAGIEQAKS